MSKRTDKKRQKRFNEVHPTTTAPAAQPVVETAAPTAEPVPEVTVTDTTTPVNAMRQLRRNPTAVSDKFKNAMEELKKNAEVK